MGKIRILYVLWNDFYGGAETHVLNLVSRIDGSIFEPEICFLSDVRWGLVRSFEEKNIPYVVIGMRSGYDVFGALRFYDFLRRTRHDIVHFHTYTFWLRLFVPLVTAAKIVTTEHGRILYSKVPVRERILRRLSKISTDKYIGVSEWITETAISKLKIDPTKITTVHHGIDSERFDPSRYKMSASNKKAELGLSDNNIIVGTVGKLMQQKNYPCLIRAATVVHSKFKNATFLIVGGGELRDSLEQEVKNLGAEEYTKFLGKRSDIPELLSIFDIFVFTTDERESFGIAMVEAMAMEVPVIASDTGAIPEVLGEAGILVPFNDHKEFAKQVCYLLENEGKRAELARKGRQRALQMFKMENMVKATEQVYKKLGEQSD